MAHVGNHHPTHVGGDATFIANTESEMKESKLELDALGLFKADLVTFTRYYESMSQIIDYDSHDLGKLSLFARHLAPLLREKSPDDDPIDLGSVELSHYHLPKIIARSGEAGPGRAGSAHHGRGLCPGRSG